jgi:hypothetical protein
LLLAGVPDGPPGGVDTAGKCRFRDDPPAPDRSQQIVFADYPIAVSDKEEQEIKHLGLDRQQHGSPPELAALGVENVISKQEPHFAPRATRLPEGALVSLAHFTRAKNQDGLNIISMPPQSEGGFGVLCSAAWGFAEFPILGDGRRPHVD